MLVECSLTKVHTPRLSLICGCIFSQSYVRVNQGGGHCIPRLAESDPRSSRTTEATAQIAGHSANDTLVQNIKQPERGKTEGRLIYLANR